MAVTAAGRSLFRVVSKAFKAGRPASVTREMTRDLTRGQLQVLARQRGISEAGSAAQLRARLFRSEEDLIKTAARRGNIVRDDIESRALARREYLLSQNRTNRDVAIARDQFRRSGGPKDSPEWVDYVTDRDIGYARDQKWRMGLDKKRNQVRNKQVAAANRRTRDARVEQDRLDTLDDLAQFEDGVNTDFMGPFQTGTPTPARRTLRDRVKNIIPDDGNLSWMQKVLRRGLNETSEHPVVATLGAAGLLTMVGPGIADGANEFVQDVSGETLRNAIEQEYHRRQQQLLFDMKQKRLQKATLENMSRLAQYAPDLYNQTLAGRQLPQGAAVFGGTKRPDLVEEIAYGMSLGAFTDQPMPDPATYMQ
jgi:hypothetical protein